MGSWGQRGVTYVSGHSFSPREVDNKCVIGIGIVIVSGGPVKSQGYCGRVRGEGAERERESGARR